MQSRFQLMGPALGALCLLVGCLQPLEGAVRGEVNAVDDDLAPSIEAHDWFWESVTAALCNDEQAQWAFADGEVTYVGSKDSYGAEDFVCERVEVQRSGTYLIDDNGVMTVTLPEDADHSLREWVWQPAVLTTLPVGEGALPVMTTRAFRQVGAASLVYRRELGGTRVVNGAITHGSHVTLLRFEAPLSASGKCAAEVTVTHSTTINAVEEPPHSESWALSCRTEAAVGEGWFAVYYTGDPAPVGASATRQSLSNKVGPIVYFRSSDASVLVGPHFGTGWDSGAMEAR